MNSLVDRVRQVQAATRAARGTPSDRARAPDAGTSRDEMLTLRAFARSPDGTASLTELRSAGVMAPAQTIYELQLRGHEIERLGHGSTFRYYGPPPAGRLAESA